jgi:hypothetical protein
VDKYNGGFSHNYIALPNANTKHRGNVDSVILPSLTHSYIALNIADTKHRGKSGVMRYRVV